MERTKESARRSEVDLLLFFFYDVALEYSFYTHSLYLKEQADRSECLA